MTARPIIFSGPMVRALLDGRKSQTRRIVKPQPLPSPTLRRWEWAPPSWFQRQNDMSGHGFVEFSEERGSNVMRACCPKGQAGDLLYVRETHAYQANEDGALTGRILYRATHDGPLEKLDENGGVIHGASPWRPSIHMPRWSSRITLRLTDVRVERVQEISEEDAKAEGVPLDWIPTPGDGTMPPGTFRGGTWRGGFRELWNSLHGHGAWDRNGWVWVLCFDVIHDNVDAVLQKEAT